MEIPDNLRIVPVEEMPEPQVICDAPSDDLAALFILAHRMRSLCTQEEGIGLSCVQVGLPYRMFVLDFQRPEMGLQVYLNCSYEPVGEEKMNSMEGCLSIPRDASGDRPQFLVPRYRHVRVTGQMLSWSEKLEVVPLNQDLTGFLAVVFQHEIDHQSGILINQVGKPFHVQKAIRV